MHQKANRLMLGICLAYRPHPGEKTRPGTFSFPDAHDHSAQRSITMSRTRPENNFVMDIIAPHNHTSPLMNLHACH